jgi:replicative DNA helicase
MGRIKKLATTMNVAVVMASSLPRSVDGESKVGSLGRGSAEIDFGADYIYFAIPDEHKNEKGERAVLWKNKKARDGDTIDLETIFDGASQTFYSAARAEEFPEFTSERVAR